MSDERQTSPGRIMSIEAVAARIVCEDPEPAHPSSTVDRKTTHSSSQRLPLSRHRATQTSLFPSETGLSPSEPIKSDLG